MYNRKKNTQVSLAFDSTWSNSAHKPIQLRTVPLKINP